MKICSVCGCQNPDCAEKCSVCGVFFPRGSAPASAGIPAAVVSVPVPEAPVLSAPLASESEKKANRMAVAGFVLSLMGLFTCITSPLQLAALILSVASGKAKKFRSLRLIGIISSAVALAVSLLVWFFFFVNADQFLPKIMEYMNKFYY